MAEAIECYASWDFWLSVWRYDVTVLFRKYVDGYNQSSTQHILCIWLIISTSIFGTATALKLKYPVLWDWKICVGKMGSFIHFEVDYIYVWVDCMYVGVYTHLCTHIHVHVCFNQFSYIYIYTHTHTHTHTHTYIYTQTYTHTCVY